MEKQYEVTKQTTMKHESLLMLVITAMFIALTYVCTSINIQLPFGGAGGLIHLGNIPFLICAMLFGKKSGAIAGGIGMALFDLLSPWASWAPFTLLIVGAMGYVVGLITEKKKGIPWYVIAILSALVIKLVGYYFAEVILYGNWMTPFSSIPGNVIQVGVAGIVVIAIIAPIKRYVKQLR